MSAARRSATPRSHPRTLGSGPRAQPPALRVATVVMLSAAGSREEAERIAAALVAERLAACVNLVAPITSVYRWRGAVERAEEVLLVVKTRRALVSEVTARIRALHSYELPEAIALPVESGAADYLAWIGAETKRRLPRTRTRGR